MVEPYNGWVTLLVESSESVDDSGLVRHCNRSRNDRIVANYISCRCKSFWIVFYVSDRCSKFIMVRKCISITSFRVPKSSKIFSTKYITVIGQRGLLCIDSFALSTRRYGIRRMRILWSCTADIETWYIVESKPILRLVWVSLITFH